MAELTPPTIKEGVYNRLPFLVSPTANTIINFYTAEAFAEVKRPLRKGEQGAALSYLDEDSYNGLEKSMVSDIVSYYILTKSAIAKTEGVAGATTPAAKILSKAQAGGVDVEWIQSDYKKSGGLIMGGEAMINQLKNDAIRKAFSLGFTLDLTTINELQQRIVSRPTQPFISVPFD